jgi:hypothetical protein
LVFICGVVPAKATETLYKDFRIEYFVGIVGAAWYIRNESLHKDMDVETVDSVIKKYAESHEQRLQRHINVEALRLLNSDGLVRRLKRTKPFQSVQYILLQNRT